MRLISPPHEKHLKKTFLFLNSLIHEKKQISLPPSIAVRRPYGRVQDDKIDSGHPQRVSLHSPGTEPHLALRGK